MTHAAGLEFSHENEANKKTPFWRDISTIPLDGDDVMLLDNERRFVLSMSPAKFQKTVGNPAHLRFPATHWAPMIKVGACA